MSPTGPALFFIASHSYIEELIHLLNRPYVRTDRPLWACLNFQEIPPSKEGQTQSTLCPPCKVTHAAFACCLCATLAGLQHLTSSGLQVGSALAEVGVPDFQPRQDVTIATDDSADSKAATSNGVDDQRGIELLIETVQVWAFSVFTSPHWESARSHPTAYSMCLLSSCSPLVSSQQAVPRRKCSPRCPRTSGCTASLSRRTTTTTTTWTLWQGLQTCAPATTESPRSTSSKQS